jgi:hypothetical protein
MTPTIANTRTEADVVEHLARLIQFDPHAGFVMWRDQRNTQKSESLVRFLAQALGDDQVFGEKGRWGILKRMQTRHASLRNPEHRLRFVSTPKHWSWLHSSDVWFSLLGKHVLNRGSFPSIPDVTQKIQCSIASYNKHLAKIWKWSVIQTKDIQALIGKVLCIEGEINPGERVAEVGASV